MEWSASDYFWTEFEDQLFDSRRWQDVDREVKALVDLLKLEKGRRILDLCCGPGRHLIGLSEAGFRMTGVDRTQRYLDETRARAQKRGLDVELVLDDIRTFCRQDAFDAVINMYNSFGYFEEQADDRKVLSNIYRSLRPGGILLIDMTGKEVLARVFVDKWARRERGARLTVYQRILNDWTWRQMQWIMTKAGQEFEYTSGHRIYSAAEMKHELSAAGFGKVLVYGDLQRGAYDQTARQMVILATK